MKRAPRCKTTACRAPAGATGLCRDCEWLATVKYLADAYGWKVTPGLRGA